jgi:hypothetical protein
MITGLNIPPANKDKIGKGYYKIGTWFYYNAKGQLYNKEIISAIRKVDK